VLDLLLTLSLAATGSPFLVEPDVHGDRVAFTCEGDLWIGSVATGRAERLTRDEGVEMDARFSPDGKTLAFTAEYDGVREVYVMPTEGGVPRRLTYTGVVGEALGWTPDGKRVIFRTVGAPNNVVFRTVPVEGGAAVPLPIEFGSYASYSPAGELAFTRFARYNEPWFGYQGGMKNDIWVADEAIKSFRKVYAAKGSSETPVWASGRIYFVQDDGGKFSVMSVRPDGRDPKRVAGPYDVEVKELASDGRHLIFEKGNGLERVDTTTGTATPITFQLSSDLLHARPYRVPAAEHVFAYSPAPNGKRALAESRGQIVSLPVDGKGEARVLLAKDGVRYRLPELSADGKRLAYVSDETGEAQVYVADADGGNPRQLTTDGGRQIVRLRWTPDGSHILFADSDTRLNLVSSAGGTPTVISRGSGREGPEFDVSPNSQWVAYSFVDFANMTSSIYLYEIGTKRNVRVSNGLTDDFTPAFTKDGNYLAFLSKRTLSPRPDDLTNVIGFRDVVRPYLAILRNDVPSPFAPEDDEREAPKPGAFRIDLEGLADRVVEIPVPSGRLAGLEAGKNALYWIDAQPDGFSLEAYDIGRKRFARMGASDDFRLTPDGGAILFSLGGRTQLVGSEVREVPVQEGQVSFGGLQLRIDPVQEWRQIYWEGWRYARDYFYTPNMHGVDWRKVGDKYAAWLPSVRSRGELDRLFRGMLAELNVSHAMITGAPSRSLKRRVSGVFLGVDLEPTGRIAKIYRGDGVSVTERSPLAEPGLNVKEGDYLIEVAGVPVKAGGSFEEALVGRPGQPVSVLVNDKPGREGARRILVRPIGSEFRLRYLDWVKSRRQEVERLSGGKVGYIHILSMTQPEMADFLRQYLPQRNKQALVIDVRFNTGGYISSQVLGFLRQKLVAYFNLRNNEGSTTRQAHFFNGPMVTLINEFSKSNGEEFPHQFRTEGLGKLIGRRTWGGEVGADPGWPLVDGGKLWIPNYGAWTPNEGWIIEGTGIEPDIDVLSDPNLHAQGRDPQLERGVKELLDELARRPGKPAVVPQGPIRRKTTGD